MAQFQVKAPNGQTYIVNAPEGATQEQVFSFVQSQMQQAPQSMQAAQAPAAEQKEAPKQEAGLGDYLRAVGQGATLGFADELEALARSSLGGGTYEQEVAKARAGLERARETNPYLAYGGEIAGSLATLPFGGAAGLAARGVRGASMAGKALSSPVGRGLLEGAIYGAGAAEGDPMARLDEAALGGAIGGAFGGISQIAGPKITEAAKKLREAGVRLTPGQYFGGATKAAEQAARQVPFAGSMVRARAEDAMKDFNRVVIDEILTPIGKKIDPKLTGREGLKAMDTVLTEAYDEALSPLSLQYGESLKSRIGQALDLTVARAADGKPYIAGSEAFIDLGKPELDVLQRYIGMMMKRFDGGVMPGDVYKTLDSDLRKAAVRYGKSQEPAKKQLGEALGAMRNALFEEVTGQAGGDAASKLRAVDFAYRQKKILETALEKPGADADYFTAAQLQRAVQQSDKRLGSAAFARGEAPLQKLSEIGKDVFGPLEYSTARDLALLGTPTGLLTSVGLGSLAPVATAGGIGGVGLLYSPGVAQKLMPGMEAARRGVAGAFEAAAPVAGGLLSQQILPEGGPLKPITITGQRPTPAQMEEIKRLEQARRQGLY